MPDTPSVIQLRPYQNAWIDDPTRFKLAVKSARIGFSYGTGVDHIFRRLAREGTTTTILSASQNQSIEFVNECQKNIKAIGAVAEHDSDWWYDEIGKSEFTVQRIRFGNGSRIMALASNPRTARGYPGDVVLDEFAHHQDSYAIWAAAFRQVALGNGLDALSTPNGEQGKFFDLAKDLGMADGVAPSPNPTVQLPWSGHWVDVYTAIAQGCEINAEEMRAGIKDDDTFAQEFECVFLKAMGAWLPLELIQASEDGNATMEWPGGYTPRNPLFMGIDVGRVRDATTVWIKERVGDVLWTRMAMTLHGVTFPKQAEIIAPWVKLCQRAAIDSTGMGIALWDLLNVQCPGRVMGVNFAGSSRLRKEKRDKARSTTNIEDGAVNMKTDLAIKLKRSMEGGKERLPYNLDVRTQLQSIKRIATASGVTFDAPRVEVESAVAGGSKQKSFMHADHFWGCALATYASQASGSVVGLTPSNRPTVKNQLRGY